MSRCRCQPDCQLTLAPIVVVLSCATRLLLYGPPPKNLFSSFVAGLSSTSSNPTEDGRRVPVPQPAPFLIHVAEYEYPTAERTSTHILQMTASCRSVRSRIYGMVFSSALFIGPLSAINQSINQSINRRLGHASVRIVIIADSMLTSNDELQIPIPDPVLHTPSAAIFSIWPLCETVSSQLLLGMLVQMCYAHHYNVNWNPLRYHTLT